MSEIAKHTEILRRLLPLDGRDVVEIGAGDGALARRFARSGARRVVAVEPLRAMLVRGLAASRKAAVERGDAAPLYLAGVAEALPLADGSADTVVYFNALHHVPVTAMAAAAAEVARLLRPGGLFLTIEPIAEGAHFELVRAVEDETAERAAAYEILTTAAAGPEFRLVEDIVYRAPVHYPDFATWRRRLVDVDPAREAKVAALEPVLREGFERVAEPDGDGRRFLQPSRATLLQRRAA